jgi:16S rRNA (guanine527-N7)-methyltransferase
MSEPDNQFVTALKEHAPHFDLLLSEKVIVDLRNYYAIVQTWNKRLHLVAPCSPEEFAVRHVLESLFALNYIRPGARVADIGSGGGLPIIPILVAGPELRATLIESSPKKAVFLREALGVLNLRERATVIANRFETVPLTDTEIITCRALDRFPTMVSKMFELAPLNSRLLLFGGTTIEEEISRYGLRYTMLKIPESRERFIFVVDKVGR